MKEPLSSGSFYPLFATPSFRHATCPRDYKIKITTNGGGRKILHNFLFMQVPSVFNLQRIPFSSVASCLALDIFSLSRFVLCEKRRIYYALSSVGRRGSFYEPRRAAKFTLHKDVAVEVGLSGEKSVLLHLHADCEIFARESQYRV